MSEWTDDDGVPLGEWVEVEEAEGWALIAEAGGLEELTVFAGLTDPEGAYGPRQIYTAWGRSSDPTPLVDIRDYKFSNGLTSKRIMRRFVRAAAPASTRKQRSPEEGDR